MCGESFTSPGVNFWLLNRTSVVNSEEVNAFYFSVKEACFSVFITQQKCANRPDGFKKISSVQYEQDIPCYLEQHPDAVGCYL